MFLAALVSALALFNMVCYWYFT